MNKVELLQEIAAHLAHSIAHQTKHLWEASLWGQRLPCCVLQRDAGRAS